MCGYGIILWVWCVIMYGKELNCCKESNENVRLKDKLEVLEGHLYKNDDNLWWKC